MVPAKPQERTSKKAEKSTEKSTEKEGQRPPSKSSGTQSDKGSTPRGGKSVLPLSHVSLLDLAPSATPAPPKSTPRAKKPPVVEAAAPPSIEPPSRKKVVAPPSTEPPSRKKVAAPPSTEPPSRKKVAAPPSTEPPSVAPAPSGPPSHGPAFASSATDSLDALSDVSSEQSSCTPSDLEFLDSENDSDENRWHVDVDVLTAPSERFVGMPGSTIGLKRFEAMIASIERRAMAQDSKRKAKKATPRPPPVPVV